MPPTNGPTHYVTAHIHTDGPIPGPHSLLTLTSVAHTAAGVPTAEFTANLRELPGAGLHPTALHTWRDRAEDWLSTRRAARPPAVVTNAYADWVTDLGGRPAFVTGPDEAEHLFCYWYLQRFTGSWPFTATVPATLLDAGFRTQFRTDRHCPLSCCRVDPLVLAAG